MRRAVFHPSRIPPSFVVALRNWNIKYVFLVPSSTLSRKGEGNSLKNDLLNAGLEISL